MSWLRAAPTRSLEHKSMATFTCRRHVNSASWLLERFRYSMVISLFAAKRPLVCFAMRGMSPISRASSAFTTRLFTRCDPSAPSAANRSRRRLYSATWSSVRFKLCMASGKCAVAVSSETSSQEHRSDTTLAARPRFSVRTRTERTRPLLLAVEPLEDDVVAVLLLLLPPPPPATWPALVNEVTELTYSASITSNSLLPPPLPGTISSPSSAASSSSSPLSGARRGAYTARSRPAPPSPGRIGGCCCGLRMRWAWRSLSRSSGCAWMKERLHHFTSASREPTFLPSDKPDSPPSGLGTPTAVAAAAAAAAEKEFVVAASSTSCTTNSAGR
mmetsp:Transcript_52248/g.89760  ORF Transcript_52248/g.89760 Transcript_52248/m.89760 type:complete len:330 (-) Transcript_52248:90-1079(-)